MSGILWQAKKCFKTLSEYRQRRCRGHVWWKTVPEVGAGNWKSPFADSGEVEQRQSPQPKRWLLSPLYQLRLFDIHSQSVTSHPGVNALNAREWNKLSQDVRSKPSMASFRSASSKFLDHLKIFAESRHSGSKNRRIVCPSPDIYWRRTEDERVCHHVAFVSPCPVPSSHSLSHDTYHGVQALCITLSSLRLKRKYNLCSEYTCSVCRSRRRMTSLRTRPNAVVTEPRSSAAEVSK